MNKIILFIFFIIIIYIIFHNSKDDYYEYLKNKNVIIVGPAGHVNNGEFIDSFDVIVRLNKGMDLSKNEPQKYGKKTNIMYLADHHSYNRLTKNEINNLNFIKFQFPKTENKNYFHPIGKNEYDFYKNFNFTNKIRRTNHEYLNFEKEIQTRPNCGTTAIWDILRYPIKSLYITGITFNTTKTSGNYYKNGGIVLKKDQKNEGPHNLKNMIDYFNRKIIIDKRVKYDKEFKKSLEHFKNK